MILSEWEFRTLHDQLRKLIVAARVEQAFAKDETVQGQYTNKEVDKLVEFLRVAASRHSLTPAGSSSVHNSRLFYVNVYYAGREYGGPEEGGWWYDTGVLIASYIAPTYDVAHQLAASLKEDFPRTGKRMSVLGGEDYDVVVEDHEGADFPKTVPHYE